MTPGNAHWELVLFLVEEGDLVFSANKAKCQQKALGRHWTRFTPLLLVPPVPRLPWVLGLCCESLMCLFFTLSNSAGGGICFFYLMDRTNRGTELRKLVLVTALRQMEMRFKAVSSTSVDTAVQHYPL